ncbi:MAG TPA: hypothetical protein DIU45_01440 [Clostridium sp.]|nr:hypothetical protein [Clostridium sp.]
MNKKISKILTKTEPLTSLTIILNCFFALGCLFTLSFCIIFIHSLVSMNIQEYGDFFPDSIFIIISTLIMYKMKVITKNFKKEDFFNLENIRAFKSIGLFSTCSFIIYCILSLLFPNIILSQYGSLKMLSMVFLIFGTFSYVLAEAFKIALSTKEENDLTI